MPGPAGSWKWTTRGFSADSSDIENALTLSMTDGEPAGTYSRGGEETPTQDAKLDESTLTFKLQLTFRDTDITLNYTGQFRGDILKQLMASIADSHRTMGRGSSPAPARGHRNGGAARIFAGSGCRCPAMEQSGWSEVLLPPLPSPWPKRAAQRRRWLCRRHRACQSR